MGGRDGVSREVPCSALKGETVPDSLPAWFLRQAWASGVRGPGPGQVVGPGVQAALLTACDRLVWGETHLPTESSLLHAGFL